MIGRHSPVTMSRFVASGCVVVRRYLDPLRFKFSKALKMSAYEKCTRQSRHSTMSTVGRASLLMSSCTKDRRSDANAEFRATNSGTMSAPT